MKFILFTLVLILNTNLYAKKPFIGRVIILKGKAKIKKVGDQRQTLLKKGDRVTEGSKIFTGKKSFLKVILKDRTQLSLGPKSSMEIQQFLNKGGRKNPGVISLLRGKLRAKIEKNYLDKTKDATSKFFIKTRSAAMGVRGTDFVTTYNKSLGTTSVVTFEGKVSMAKIDDQYFKNIKNDDLINKLELMVRNEGAVHITEGRFSGVSPKTSRPNQPVKISPMQFNSMRENASFSTVSKRNKENTQNQKQFRSITLPGMDGRHIAGDEKAMQKEMMAIIGKEVLIQTFKGAMAERFNNDPAGAHNAELLNNEGVEAGLDQVFEMAKMASNAYGPNSEENSPPPEGMFNPETGEYAPRAGGFIDINSGVYVPPPANASFDPHTGTFIVPSQMGNVDFETGNYIPPKGLAIDTRTGRFVQDYDVLPEGRPRSLDSNKDPARDSRNSGERPPPGGKYPPGAGPGMYPPGMGPGMYPPGTDSGVYPPGGDPGMYPPGTEPGAYPPEGGFDPDPEFDCPECTTYPDPAQDFCLLNPEDPTCFPTGDPNLGNDFTDINFTILVNGL